MFSGLPNIEGNRTGRGGTTEKTGRSTNMMSYAEMDGLVYNSNKFGILGVSQFNSTANISNKPDQVQKFLSRVATRTPSYLPKKKKNYIGRGSTPRKSSQEDYSTHQYQIVVPQS